MTTVTKEATGPVNGGGEAADTERTAHWRAVAAATGPADRAAAEAGVRLAYALAGLAPPEAFVWVGSPLAGTAAALLLAGRQELLPGPFAERAANALAAAGVRPEPGAAGASVREAVRTLPWERVRRELLTALGPSGWAERWARTAAPLWDITRGLTERIRTGLTETLTEGSGRAEPEVRLAALEAVAGQHDAPWLAAVSADPGGAGSDPLAGVAAVARAAGWWWPYEKAVIISERPVELHRDEAGRLDRADGPALAFPDGFALHAWRGMPVPADFLRQLGELTPDRIRTEENAELRRVMLESYGYDRYLAESGAEPVHRDATGVLWRIQLPDDEPVAMVEVVNSTPEPDGTHRTYWLRVPPRVATAREGVAWTFGLDADAYAPERET
ncbi:DUF6745 domain-containing protein [Streptomyces sp. NEAU-Y11]|uniref:DUF6745 domain-containing protein n=1 Tax=Streptomyces cucumeris TaxID=2962890 RepID=UPI0020C90EA6|nr:hypothetical protein [Streptomyces sp. NEAU-Y11]MCP9208160.1 hypothetical protein [Streptomyces sp. NEAU-Y11]